MFNWHSGLCEGTVITPGYCDTNVAAAKIYINVSSDPPVMYIDGVRAITTKMTADTLITGTYHLGYFSRSGEEVFSDFYYDLDWVEELDDEWNIYMMQDL